MNMLSYDGVVTLMTRRDWLRIGAFFAGAGSAVLISKLLWRRFSCTKTVTIASLFVYPIKGCRGHSVQQAELTRCGLKGDRVYMVIDRENKFVSQRQFQGLAYIHPEIPTEAGVKLVCAPECPSDKIRPSLFVPLIGGAPTSQTTVWKDTVPAVDQGEEAAAWLQAITGQQGVRLVHIASCANRLVKPQYGDGAAAFADGFPILVTSQASISDVASRVGPRATTSIDRFRTNVHVTGCRAWEEDEIRSLEFKPGTADHATLTLVKPCSRCQVPTIDQATGERTKGGEPARTLRLYREGKHLARFAKLHKAFFSDQSQKDEYFFGQNALLRFTPGAILKVGDVASVSF